MDNKERALQLFSDGKFKKQQGDLIGAVALFTQSIVLDPDNAEAYVERGGILLSMGDKKAATNDMLEAVRLNPKLVDGVITNK